MRILQRVLCLSLMSIAVLFFSADTHSHSDSHPSATKADIPQWKKHLKAFEVLIETESDFAATELTKVAETLFEKHRHVDEWKALYYRLSRDKKGSIADHKRVCELVLEMLTDIDTQKHQAEIQRFEKRVKYYDHLAKQLESKGESPTNVTAELTRFQLRDVWMDDIEALDKHIKVFHELLPKDKKAARAELDAYATVQFGEHPLVEEWTDILFQMSVEGSGKLPTYIRMCQLQLQMYKEVNAEKYADQIAAYESALKRLEATGTNNGEDLDIEFRLSSRY